LPIHLADEPTQERDRQEHGVQYEHDRDHGPADLGHRAARCIARADVLVAHVPLDVLEHDDRVVDDDADGQHHAE
jgi:hypothetical protein